MKWRKYNSSLWRPNFDCLKCRPVSLHHCTRADTTDLINAARRDDIHGSHMIILRTEASTIDAGPVDLGFTICGCGLDKLPSPSKTSDEVAVCVDCLGTTARLEIPHPDCLVVRR